MSICLIYLAIQQLCTFIAFFLYIFLCRRCTTTTWKLLISLFWRTWTQEKWLSFCFPEFRYNTVFKNSPPEKFTNIWRNWTRWNKCVNWLKSRWAGFINRGEYKISHSTSCTVLNMSRGGLFIEFPSFRCPVKFVGGHCSPLHWAGRMWCPSRS